MHTSSHKALIVDDDWTARQLAGNALRRIGLDCHYAANAQQALEKLGACDYSVVVTDLIMPGLNGHQLSLTILDLPNRPVLVVVTGVTNPRISEDLRNRGVDDVQFKPLDSIRLSATVQSLVPGLKPDAGAP